MIKKLTFEIDVDKIKKKDDFLGLLDKVLKYKFVGFYNDNGIIHILHKRKKDIK